ncbi:MAG: hypothetical protein H0U04_20740 [Rubrobacter sp.]|nr:hypothetical protein [Rubrobacter sp.]
MDGDASLLTLGAISSNLRLVPNSNVTFAGSGETRTATISTVSGRTGSSTVQTTGSDGQSSASVDVKVQVGGNSNNTLSGTEVADLILGQNGDDILSGMGASDVLCGANRNDRLSGGSGADTMDGGLGTDTTSNYAAKGMPGRTYRSC